MSDAWRIFVVEGEESLNRSIVNSLLKDGYFVQGALSDADALRVLWTEEFDVVICDLKTSVGGFDFMQWLRAYRPRTQTIIVGSEDTPLLRSQALESGAAGYLAKPLDLRLLREELRRLLQPAGFTADLDSFDLLDVIQIVTMSRKNIALLVSTGVEERGMLRFQKGELVSAEYGMLRGEEAFFALAAHKNGTVMEQPWSGQIVSNVTQPLSRLILQALQYRSKYAHGQPQEEAPANALSGSFAFDEVDDSPFVFAEDASLSPMPQASAAQENLTRATASQQLAALSAGEAKEWWEQSAHIPLVEQKNSNAFAAQDATAAASTFAFDVTPFADRSEKSMPSAARKTQEYQRTELPGWVMDQPTSGMPATRPSPLADALGEPATAQWQESPVQPLLKTTDPLTTRKSVDPYTIAPTESGARRISSPEWQAPMSARESRVTNDLAEAAFMKNVSDALSLNGAQGSTWMPDDGATMPRKSVRRQHNYTALVSALQTLGYSVPGFIAAGVLTTEGEPIAQVAVDNLDITRLCKPFCLLLQHALQSLSEETWGTYESTIITTMQRHILLRVVHGEQRVVQVLITSREADPADGLEVMINIEGVINAALR
ncbi:MAG TPA: response regulator [Ktedonobacteraceae bacterium]|nr:response regulator [Ktedonobacteraceae bacterium]